MFEMVDTSNLYKNRRGMNQSQVIETSSTSFADKYAECQFMIDNEKDPIRKQKMINRLAFGNTNFDDLK